MARERAFGGDDLRRLALTLTHQIDAPNLAGIARLIAKRNHK